MARVHVPIIERPLKQDEACTRCPLHKKSQTVCCGTTRPKIRPSGIMLVGEALGAVEEQRGRPFVGDAGRKLNYCLHRAKLNRKSLYIGNACRCRPPANKPPSASQLQSCYPYLLYDILKIKPKVIVALGASAWGTLTGDVQPTGKLKQGTRGVLGWRGFYEARTYSWTSPKGRTISHSCWVVPALHPAMCLRSWEYDDLLVFDLESAKSLATGTEPLHYPDTKVRVADTLPKAMELLKRLRRRGRFVIDLETTGLDPHTAEIMCAGFCYKDGEADILPLRRQGGGVWWSPNAEAQIKEEMIPLLEEAELIGQNLKFDTQHLRKWLGIVDYKIAMDTMLAHGVIDENKPHNLTFLCQQYLRWKKYDAMMAQYYNKMVDSPDKARHDYCGYDVDGTWQLSEIFGKEIGRQRLRTAYQIQEDLIAPLADAEFRGIQCDRKTLDKLSYVYRKEAAGIEKKLQISAFKIIGRVEDKKGEVVHFNPRSPQQLGALLKQAGAKLDKKTPGGSISTNKYVMEALALKKNKAGRIAANITRLRKVSKYISTYLDGGDGGFKRWLAEHDRWHPNYNLATARTGRLSADDPPVQTLPRTGGLRNMVVPDRGRVMLTENTPPEVIARLREHGNEQRILAVDYDKIEMRTIAWLASDSVMVDELMAGIDLHTKTAVTARLMRNPTEDEWKRMAPLITKDERGVAKGVNFGVLYGRGAYAIAEANPDSFPADMSPRDRADKVQRVIDAFFDKYEQVRRFREDAVDKMREQGQLRTCLFGRVRHLYGLDWFDSRYGEATSHRDLDLSHMEREAMNFETQSIASLILNRQTRRVYDGIKKVRIPGLRIILTLHDALVFTCHVAYTDEAIHHIRRWMEVTLKRGKGHKHEVPLTVSPQVMRHFGEEYEDAA